MIKTDIKEIEIKTVVQSISESNICFFGKISKTGKLSSIIKELKRNFSKLSTPLIQQT